MIFPDFVKVRSEQRFLAGVGMAGQGSGGNVLAALCSLFIPGLGQLLQGRLLAAILFFAITVVGYALWWLVIPAIIAALAHLFAILDAARFRS
jgi:TM2 domain-containing membrane protein YozV